MTALDWTEIFLFILLLLAATPLMGRYMALLFGSSQAPFPSLASFEKGIYNLSGIDASKEMNGREYLNALLLFSGIGLGFLFFILLLQGYLPLQAPKDFPVWSGRLP